MQWSKYKGQNDKQCSTVVITICLTVTKYRTSIDNESFTFILPSVTANTFPDMTVYMSNTVGVLLEA
jgi:hypothetical protein